jgi:uncharacterized YkwD family protein
MRKKISIIIACITVLAFTSLFYVNKVNAFGTNDLVKGITQNTDTLANKPNCPTNSGTNNTAVNNSTVKSLLDTLKSKVQPSTQQPSAKSAQPSTQSAQPSTGNNSVTANKNCPKSNLAGTIAGNDISKLMNIFNQFKLNTTNTTTAPKTTTTVPKTTTTTTAPKTTTTTTAPKTTTTQPTGDYSAFQKRVLELVNIERSKAGLKPLTFNSTLNKTATLKSQDMAQKGYFDHNSPTYGSPFDMMKKYGVTYRTAGENIAMGQTTPEQVMQGWMNSPGHRANILNASFTQIGVGVAKNANGQLYWTQQFIG